MISRCTNKAESYKLDFKSYICSKSNNQDNMSEIQFMLPLRGFVIGIKLEHIINGMFLCRKAL